MLHKTRGIVLHTVKFSETSIIARIYTEAFGLQSYLVRGIRKQHAKTRPALFQPLTILDLTVYHKEKSTLHAIRDVQILHPYQTLPFDVVKSSIALYMNELLYRSVKQEEQDEDLFSFLLNSCLELDSMETGFRIIPLKFTLQLTKFLGFPPRSDDMAGKGIFNMREGIFQDTPPDHKYYLAPPLSTLLSGLISGPEGKQMIFSATDRNRLLDELLVYYRLHLPGFGEIHSHKVLHSVLS